MEHRDFVVFFRNQPMRRRSDDVDVGQHSQPFSGYFQLGLMVSTQRIFAKELGYHRPCRKFKTSVDYIDYISPECTDLTCLVMGHKRWGLTSEDF